MSLFDLSGKTAVVIAGTSRLGGAMAEGLARHGARLAVVGRERERAEAIAHEIRETCQAETASFACDATRKTELETLLAGVLQWSPAGVDVLLHCPGKNSATPFFELSMAEWDEIMDVNCKSAVLACQVFGAHMVERGRGGSIITVSSVAADPPLSKVFSYAASKAALESVTKFLARELAPHAVRVNAIVPGFFPSEQNRSILSSERIEAIVRHTPLGRLGEPRELQGVVVWLASEQASSFVTGALIRVDGGFGAMTI